MLSDDAIVSESLNTVSRDPFGEDRRWIAVMACATATEFVWWITAWAIGIAPAPFLGTYLALTFGGVAATLAIRQLLFRDRTRPTWIAIVAATALTAAGASLFLPLKVAIPKEIPFWLDGPLAFGERRLFGADPWLLLDQMIGWSAIPLDHLYALWLPVQSLVLFIVMLEPPSRAKSRALIAYSLAWFLLGVAAATIFSSAGPLFYDRLFGGSEFATLRQTLTKRGGWMALAESDKMWAAIGSKQASLVSGISAFPSMHVAISVWIYLTARALAPRAAVVALLYAVIVWIASVQLGWHYVADGLAGVAAMIAMWALAGRVERILGGVARTNMDHSCESGAKLS